MLWAVVGYSQINLPKEFRCVDGLFSDGKVKISSYKIYHKYKSVKNLKYKLENDSEGCCGKYTITNDSLIIGKGTTDTEGEGAGLYFYRIYNTNTNTVIVVYSQFNNEHFKDWCDWILRSIRGLSSEKNNEIYNHKNQPCN